MTGRDVLDGSRLAGRTVLAVFAHPDDEALACGGTLARLAEAGARVVIVCASRGELGSVSSAALVAGGDVGAARVGELAASASVLGAAKVVQLEHPDGTLTWADALDREIADEVARQRPDAVITFDADGLYWHADHIAVHDRVTAALSPLGAEAPALYYVSMAPGTMRAVVDAAHARGGARDGGGLWGISPDAFGVATPTPTFRIDVRPWIDRKLTAIRCHRTQVGAGSPFLWIDQTEAARLLGFEQFRRAQGSAGRPAILEALADETPR
jgi:N-acetyl-1-D-myo-inositol-2-amino-2-deoxy-alpha-D-glucopyranoside deacetylase